MRVSQRSRAGSDIVRKAKLSATTSASGVENDTQVWRMLLAANGKHVLGPSMFICAPVVDLCVRGQPAKSASA